jgi:CDGSH iron-sulfur domain-containing protein 3
MEANKGKKAQAIVEVIEFGPLKITGNFLVKDFKMDTENAASEIYLCRCGKSGNKPFCDESHKK